KIVRSDEPWAHCLELALNSRSDNQRYGAYVELNGEVVGEGWNRLLGRGEPFPFRTTFFLHAERAAIGSALLNTGRKDLNGGIVYVGGLIMPDFRPLVRRLSALDKCTCEQCAKLYERFGLSTSAIMAESGWYYCSTEELLRNTQENAHNLRTSGES